LNGSGSIVEIAKIIWDKHEKDLFKSGDLFYTCQYDYRWAGKRLKNEKIIKEADLSPKGIWELK